MRCYVTQAVLLVAALTSGCEKELPNKPEVRDQGQDSQRLIVANGCGSCHTIAGINAARGRVGPPLSHFSQHSYIAGILPNTYDNLVTWLMVPNQVHNNTAMTNVDLSRSDAEAIAQYLFNQ